MKNHDAKSNFLLNHSATDHHDRRRVRGRRAPLVWGTPWQLALVMAVLGCAEAEEISLDTTTPRRRGAARGTPRA